MYDVDRISTFENILVCIRDIIQESEEFKDIDVYFDDSELSPNDVLPCVSFKVGQKEVLSSSALCTEYSRRLEIRLHTETLDKRKLQSELYSFEEQLVSVLNEAKLDGRIPDFFDIEETGSSQIYALMFNAKKEANQFNMIFFSNLLRVRFVVRYKI
jgi:hypothetical protein